MKKKEFAALLAQVDLLTAKQKARMSQALDASQAKPPPGQVIDEEFSAQRACPACGSQSVQKWGIVSGLQRYRCKECKRTFNALTGTSMAHLRKKELWEQYSQALSESLSLSKAAQRCGIDRTTAFRWRHRFLPRSGEQKVKCSGITEIDETYFRESFKGKRVGHRPAHQRGKLNVRGLSTEQIPVVVARNRNGNTSGAVCPRCGVRFSCGVEDGRGECWCMKRPALPLEPGAAGGCLCPACFDRALSERNSAGAE